MKDFAGKSAIVTGAASGIGLGIARALARAGMNVALADLKRRPLEAAEAGIAALGVRTAAIELDVTDRDAMADAADRVEREFGKVHVLVNNAGVGYSGTPLDEISSQDYDWVIGVNLYGVINGTTAFVPRIKKHGEGGHVVNTSSMAGLRVMPGWHHGLYSTTKFAVVGFSEGLRDDLEPANIGVSVLCPAAVRTKIYTAGRNRPERFGGAFERPRDHPLFRASQTGMDPDTVGEQVRWCVERNEMYVITHPETRPQIEERHRGLMRGYDSAEEYYAKA